MNKKERYLGLVILVVYTVLVYLLSRINIEQDLFFAILFCLLGLTLLCFFTYFFRKGYVITQGGWFKILRDVDPKAFKFNMGFLILEIVCSFSLSLYFLTR